MAVVEREVVGLAGALRDGAARPGPQAALPRPGLLRAREVEQLWPRVWQMACRLEEIPQPARLRGVRVPRPVGHRPAHRRHGRGRVPERVPPSRRQARPGRRDLRQARSGARSTAGATGSTARTPRSRNGGRFAEHNLVEEDLDLTPVRCEMWGGCAWINFDARRPSGARVPRTRRDDPRRVEAGVDAGREVVRVPPPGELEARHRGVRGDVPRRADAPAARHPHALRDPRRARRSTRRRSSTPTSSTSAR